MTSSPESSDPASCVREAERILRYSFQKPGLLQEALTHSTSSNGAISYERLEFLGDAALRLALAKHWYSVRPDFGPHHLTILQSATLSNNNLSRVALRHGIYPLIRHNCPGLDKEVEVFKKTITQETKKNQIHGGSTKKAPKVLADVVEAVAAAVYEDCNFNLNLMWKVVKRLLKPLKTLGQIRKTTLSSLHMKSKKDVKFCKVPKGHTTLVKFHVSRKMVSSESPKQKRIARLTAAHHTVKMLRREKPNPVIKSKLRRKKSNPVIKSKPKKVRDEKVVEHKLYEFCTRRKRRKRSKKVSSGSSHQVSSGSCEQKWIARVNATQGNKTHPKNRPEFNSSEALTSVPLNDKNYISWAKSAKDSLIGKGLLGFITGDKKKPNKSGDAQEDWNIANGQTVTLIMNSLEPQLSEMFCYCDTATELWKAIENQYCNQKNHSHVYRLKMEIAKLSQENRSIPELIGHVRAKYRELKMFNPSTTNLEMLQEREESDQVYTFLAALDPSYEEIRTQILLSEEKLTFSSVMALIQQEGSRRAAMDTSDPNPMLEGHASSPLTFSSNKGKEKKETGKCGHCKRGSTSHSHDECWVLHPDLQPRQGRDCKKGKQQEVEKFSAAQDGDEGSETPRLCSSEKNTTEVKARKHRSRRRK